MHGRGWFRGWASAQEPSFSLWKSFCTTDRWVVQIYSQLFFWGKTARVSSISRLLCNRPVDRSRSIPTVDKDSPTWEYGRYRRSIRIHLFENTSISTVDKDSPTCKYGRYRIDRGFQQKSVEIEHRCWFIPKKIIRYRPSICPHTKKKSVDGWYRPCMYRLLDWG